jgi:ParB family chromosome partitioning protein
MDKTSAPKQIVLVNPFRCRLWDLHDRFEASISEDACRAEIDSFSRHGQIVPALGRPLHGDSDYDVELICGARRLFVARHINIALAVELRDLTDRDALILMDTENRQREDISAYERGMSYSRWLRSGHFQSQEDIARALKISAAQVSRLLKLVRLPAVIVDAFASPAEIHESWGLDLVEALDDAGRRDAIIRRARVIGRQTPRPNGTEVYRQLLTATGKGRRASISSRDLVVKDNSGQSLFRIRQLRTNVAVLLPIERVPPHTLAQIRDAISAIMCEGTAPRLSERPSSGSRKSVEFSRNVHVSP